MSSPKSVPVRMLIINPNTSRHMTDALQPIVAALGFDNVRCTYFTCPEPGIPSINSPEDASKSADLCLPHLIELLPLHDVFLVACYSQHPLVGMIKRECDVLQYEATKGSGGRGARKYVTGIFEASVTASLALVGAQPREAFGIVSTGKVWEDALRAAVTEMLGASSRRFIACCTTGLSAGELHDLPSDVVSAKMKDATKQLLSQGRDSGFNTMAICLGCAGMVGLEDAVRAACEEVLGEEQSKRVSIVDGVKAGVGTLVALARSGF